MNHGLRQRNQDKYIVLSPRAHEAATTSHVIAGSPLARSISNGHITMLVVPHGACPRWEGLSAKIEHKTQHHNYCGCSPGMGVCMPGGMILSNVLCRTLRQWRACGRTCSRRLARNRSAWVQHGCRRHIQLTFSGEVQPGVLTPLMGAWRAYRRCEVACRLPVASPCL